MVTAFRSRISLILGVLMMALGIFLFARLFVLQLHPVTGTRIGDTLFATFFLLRGGMNVRMRKRPPPPVTINRGPRPPEE